MVDIVELIKIKKINTLFKKSLVFGEGTTNEQHHFWEFFYVLSGTVSEQIWGEKRILKKGDIVFHAPMVPHSFSIESPRGATILNCSYDPSGNIVDHFNNLIFSCEMEQQILFDSLIISLKPSINGNYIDKIFHYLPDNEYFFHDYDIDVYKQMIALRIELILLSIYNTTHNISSKESYDNNIFLQANKYIHSNLSQSPTVESIADFCGVSVSKLKRVFGTKTSKCVHEYVLSIKINRAIELLATGVSITNIAEMLGFSSQAYFSYCFKREIGKSPLDYKKTSL